MDSKSILPKTIRANGGSSIQLISIKNGRIVLIDRLNFFGQSLAKLPQNLWYSEYGQRVFSTCF